MSVLASHAENTYNALLCEELRRLGIEAWFEEHFLTKFGTSKPDIYLTLGQRNYFVEGKQNRADENFLGRWELWLVGDNDDLMRYLTDVE